MGVSTRCPSRPGSQDQRPAFLKRSDDAQGFEVIRKRWIVERTFSWIDKCRRLSNDYERLAETAAAMVHLAMIINLMFHRLAPEA